MSTWRFVFGLELVGPLKASFKDTAAAAHSVFGLWRAGGVRDGGSPRRVALPPPGSRGRALLLTALGVASLGVLQLGLGIAALFGPGPALAANIEPGLFEEVDEGARQILAFLSNLPEDANETALGQMFFVYNAGLLVLAGFLLVYHSVAGTVDTAREGRFGFGGWEIVRIVAAVALLAPLPGGLNGGQHAVLGLAQLGGDFAGAVWRPFSAAVFKEGKVAAPRPSDAGVRRMLTQVLLMETCRAAANQAAAQAGETSYVRVSTGSGVGEAWRRYDGAKGGLPKSLCGAIRFVGLEDEDARRAAAWGHRRTLEALIPDLKALGERLAAHYVEGAAGYGEPLPDVEVLLREQRLAERYHEVIGGVLDSAVDTQRQAVAAAVARDVETASWLSAASYFNTLAHQWGRFQAAAYHLPEASAPLGVLESWSPAADAAVKGVTVALATSREYPPSLIPGALVGAGTVAGGGADVPLPDGLFEYIEFESVMVAQSGNPIADLANLGNSLINWALGAMGVLAGVAGASGMFKMGAGLLRGLDFFASSWPVVDGVVSTLLGILLIAGVVLAYLLPALPFIRFLFGIVGWIVAVVVAVLAVSVFLAAHVTRGDGDRLTTNATRQGWLFLPGLILRPVLMLFGLILGYFVFVAGIELLNLVWLPQLRDAHALAQLGLVGGVSMIVLYVILCYGLMNASFKLIELLPGAVLGWIGGRDEGDGAEAGVAAGVAAGAAGRLGQLRIGGAARRGGARARDGARPAGGGAAPGGGSPGP